MEAVYHESRLSRDGRAIGWPGKLLAASLGAAVALAATIVFLVAIRALAPADMIEDELWRDALLGFANPDAVATRVLVAATAGLVAIAALYLTVRGLVGPSRPSAPARANHIVSADEHGVVAVDSASICTLAETAVLRGARVLDARVDLRGRGNAPVNLKVEVLVHDGANLSVIGNEARKHAQRAVETLAGLEVGNVAVRLEVAEADRMGRVLL